MIYNKQLEDENQSSSKVNKIKATRLFVKEELYSRI